MFVRNGYKIDIYLSVELVLSPLLALTTIPPTILWENLLKKSFALSVVALAALVSGCVSTDMKMGSADAKTEVTGGAAGASSTNVNTKLERCDSPLGTVSLVENQQAGWYTILTGEYRLPPTSNLLRLMIQQSNCFVVVERSAAGMNAMSRERALMASGESRQGSNFGKGQMVASDYGLSPEIIFSEGNTGGMGAALGGMLGGGAGRVLGTVAAGTKTREASTMLTLVDNRSGVQVSASEGSASKTDFGAFGGLFGGAAGGGVGGYSNTPQGKVIAAAFMDAYNQMVKSLRNYKAQSVSGQGLGGGGRLGVDGGVAPSQTSAQPQQAPAAAPAAAPKAAPKSTTRRSSSSTGTSAPAASKSSL